MTEHPGAGAGTEVGAGKPLGENAFLKFVQRPRIMLLLLSAWSFLAFLTQIFTSSGLFVEAQHGADLKLDGALGGLALGWEGIPLGVLYLYCARDPVRYQRIFWLALIHQASLAVGILYHLVLDTFSFESAVIPLAVSISFATLVFLQLFKPREEHEVAAEQAR